MQSYCLTVKFLQFYFVAFFHLFFNIHSSLDRCELSIRDSVYIFQATVEALGLSCDDYPSNKPSLASNTGRLNGGYVLLEQKLDKELLIFAYSHPVYELVLKSVFESKFPKDSPDIPLFKKFKDNWKNINPNAIETCTDFAKQHLFVTRSLTDW